MVPLKHVLCSPCLGACSTAGMWSHVLRMALHRQQQKPAKGTSLHEVQQPHKRLHSCIDCNLFEHGLRPCPVQVRTTLLSTHTFNSSVEALHLATPPIPPTTAAAAPPSLTIMQEALHHILTSSSLRCASWMEGWAAMSCLCGGWRWASSGAPRMTHTS